MSAKFYLGARCYRWGTFCAQPFGSVSEAQAAVTRPSDASSWFIVEWQGSSMVGEASRLGGDGVWS